MTVHFNGAPKINVGGGLYEKLYTPGKTLFTAPERINGAVSRITQKENQNILQKLVVNPIARTLGWVSSNALTYDYNKMIPLGSRLRVAQAPIGPLMMMFLPFTILPRMFQALKRGEGDKSEFFDIIRRDLPTIGILLFALDPMVKMLNIVKSKFDGMTIVESTATKGKDGAVKRAFGEVFSYSKLKNIFTIDVKNHNPDILYQIAKQGNEKGMRDALDKITGQWLRNPHLGQVKANEIHAFKRAVNGMLDEVAKGANADETLAKKLSGDAFKLIDKLDGFRARRFGSLTDTELPKLADFLARHAKTRRLPIDIISFALVCVGIGWLPVWFNDLWNRKKHAEKQAAALQAAGPAAPFDAAATFAAFKQSSKINPFAGRPAF